MEFKEMIAACLRIIKDEVTVRMSLCLIKHHATKT
jgi:hypothetical protein